MGGRDKSDVVMHGVRVGAPEEMLLSTTAGGWEREDKCGDSMGAGGRCSTVVIIHCAGRSGAEIPMLWCGTGGS